ncbi:Cd2+/Zn2+-exporting ATPase [Tepidibacillus fermentans]|uniref:Cd(2+)-exporting ATPase n=1 Tax=Tepidibacillus fermentans TaxID=1281767 RepID=A0A4R3KB59_9BACI|nr:Cd2+/Zn2+-exporting ATPase [Tepidibacillus fermentans]
MKQKTFLEKNQHLLYTGLSLIFILIAFITQWSGYSEYVTATLFIIATLLGGRKNIRNGIPNLLKFKFNMDTLMTVAVIGAVFIGYWEEAAVVAFLFGISDALEVYTMERARRSIRSLMEIAPKKAMIIRQGEEIELQVEEIEIGDIMLVKPGEKIAMDGDITKGSTSINQAAITGESIPVDKGIGDEVFAGTLNQSGAIEVKVTKLVHDTTISKIITMVEDAQEQKAPSQSFVDRFAKYYTPSIMILAVLIALVPPLAFGGEWKLWLYNALALLIVGCPCALVVSTPVAIVTAIGNAAKNGVLIKGGIHLENAGSIKAVAFDKTGTLTQGKPVVTDVIPLNNQSEEGLLSIAASIEKYSEHPLATAIVNEAEDRWVMIQKAEDFQAILGKGAKATIHHKSYMIGSPRMFEELGMCIEDSVRRKVSNLQVEGKTVMLLGEEKEGIIALFAVADEVRDVSKLVIQQLKAAGIERTIMLTGDNEATARSIAKKVGINEYRAELLPEDKVTAVQELNREYQQIAMIGDGINDAPALATATVGIAMGGAGTDTALETADIALMADDLSKLPYTIRLSRATLRVIKQNIGFALGIKAIATLLVFPGWLTL